MSNQSNIKFNNNKVQLFYKNKRKRVTYYTDEEEDNYNNLSFSSKK